jgi:hypothetical protein
LRTDNTTQKSGVISQGDRIEANVNEHILALSIRSAHGKEAGHGNEPDHSGKTSSMGRWHKSISARCGRGPCDSPAAFFG